jgi:hypothetical protein
MTDQPYKKISADRASEVCQDLDLDGAALALLSPGTTPAEFIGHLMERALYPDAVKFLARALPKREATWWAYLGARHALGETVSPLITATLESAKQWVYEPSEDNRRAAYAAAQATDFQHPASWAAMAAFWSGGSMAPPDVPAVLPADNLTGKAVAGAIVLAAVLREPERAPEKFRLFLSQGLDIAHGGNGMANT